MSAFSNAHTRRDIRLPGGVGSPLDSDSPLAHIRRTDKVVSPGETNGSRAGGCGRPVVPLESGFALLRAAAVG